MNKSFIIRGICIILLVFQALIILTGCAAPQYVDGAMEIGKAYPLDIRFFSETPSDNPNSSYKLHKDKDDFITEIELKPNFVGNSLYRFSAAEVTVVYYFNVVDDSPNATPKLVPFTANVVYLGANGDGSSKIKIERRRFSECIFDHIEYTFNGSVTVRQDVSN